MIELNLLGHESKFFLSFILSKLSLKTPAPPSRGASLIRRTAMEKLINHFVLLRTIFCRERGAKNEELEEDDDVDVLLLCSR